MASKIIFLILTIIYQPQCSAFVSFQYHPRTLSIPKNSYVKKISTSFAEHELVLTKHPSQGSALYSVGIDESSSEVSNMLIGDDSASFSLEDQVSYENICGDSLLSISLFY